MTLLLEAAGHGDQTGAIITGIVTFIGLLGLLFVVLGVGASRPHTVSERE
ncbi:MAG: hypothetical protein Q4F65_08550 [Propionibacteriaceae bacterium]|nr:hypothetical protein [Propionibacteriaceae bacterium]